MRELSVAFDYICPWCWVAWQQAKRLKEDYPGLLLRWRGYEILPVGLPVERAPTIRDAARKPRVPTRLELLEAADGVVVPKRRRVFSRSRLALEGAEFAAETGNADEYHEAMYRFYWEQSRDIANRDVLRAVASAANLDVAAFDVALDDRRYRDCVIEFDEPAHSTGIWHMPTRMFPEEWIVEQPYVVVRACIERFMSGEAMAPVRMGRAA